MRGRGGGWRWTTERKTGFLGVGSSGHHALGDGEARAESSNFGQTPQAARASGAGPALAQEETLASCCQGNPDSEKLAMASGTGGSWGAHPPQGAAPTVRAEPGSRACLYRGGLGRWRSWGAVPAAGWWARGLRTPERERWVFRRATPSRRGRDWQGSGRPSGASAGLRRQLGGV